MDAKIKARWIAALRSGEYQQGAGQLHNSHNQFCCLGVLAAISGECAWDEAGDAFVGGKQVSSSDEFYLRPEFAGLSRDVQKSLAKMNDNGRSFTEISDYIEKNITPSNDDGTKTPPVA